MASDGTSFAISDVDRVVEVATRMRALVVGPGLGSEGSTREAVRTLMAALPFAIPLVVDADGLNALVGTMDGRNAPWVVTPHAAEMARLTGLSIEAVLRDPIGVAREAARGAGKIGTTGRGIGPAYEDKAARRAIRVQDLLFPERFSAKLREVLDFHNFVLTRHLDAAAVDFAQTRDAALALAERMKPLVADVPKELYQANRDGKNLLFEGAQGALLDVDHGTYPYVTSSNTVAGQAAAGSGIGPRGVGYVLGIAKAYTTRVGDGPFPTELTNEIGQGLGDRGKEFGTNTGRRRRCGWFDAVMVRQAVKLNGIDGIALTKLDVLDGEKEIKVCVGYELDGKRIERFPFTMGAQAKLKPIYETFEGWSESTQGARAYSELPATCIKYVRRVEELVGCPVALLSTSPQREDTILMTDPFRD